MYKVVRSLVLYKKYAQFWRCRINVSNIIFKHICLSNEGKIRWPDWQIEKKQYCAVIIHITIEIALPSPQRLVFHHHLKKSPPHSYSDWYHM